jgi:hypothetical protein
MATFVLHNTDKHKEQAAENRKGDNPHRALEFGGWLETASCAYCPIAMARDGATMVLKMGTALKH